MTDTDTVTREGKRKVEASITLHPPPGNLKRNEREGNIPNTSDIKSVLIQQLFDGPNNTHKWLKHTFLTTLVGHTPWNKSWRRPTTLFT